MLRRLVLALALVAGASFAHRPFTSPNASPIRQGLVEAVEGFTLDEIIAWSDARFARAARFGRYVRWGGAITLRSVAVLGALDWFYNQAKQATSTSLDDWWNWANGIPHPVPSNMWDYAIAPPRYWEDHYQAHIATYVWARDEVQVRYVLSECFLSSDSCPASLPSEAEIVQRARDWVDTDRPRSGTTWVGPVAVRFLTDDVMDMALVRTTGGNPRPSLPDWLRQHPDAADGVKRAFREYITENDPQSFSQPWPGVQLDPVPTGNQWWDNPFFNPLEDTDQDGWPDWFEWDTGSDPANPSRQPLPTADPDGDGYDNASERDAMTDPTDPSSRPDVDTGDSDQDGMPDSSDPCPDDPNNQCQPEENPEEIPDPLIPTLRTPDMPALERGPLPEVAQRIEAFKQHVQEQLDSLWDTVKDRFPFGMARWVPAPPSGVGSDCPPLINLSFTVGGQELTGQVDICNTPPYQWMQSTGRTLLIPVVLIGFAFAVLRRSSNA